MPAIDPPGTVGGHAKLSLTSVRSRAAGISGAPPGMLTDLGLTRRDTRSAQTDILSRITWFGWRGRRPADVQLPEPPMNDWELIARNLAVACLADDWTERALLAATEQILGTARPKARAAIPRRAGHPRPDLL